LIGAAAAFMAAFVNAIAGGWFGMRLANVVPGALLRAIIMLCGGALTVVYAVKLFH
jgi:uncharacterized membrane protein YfcA